MSTDQEPGTSVFVNEDGSPAAWLEPVPLALRRRKFTLWFGSGLLLGLACWATQYKNGVLAWDNSYVGIIPLAIGLVVGGLLFRQKETRKYSMSFTAYSHRKRLLRSGGFWVLAVIMFILFLSAPSTADPDSRWWLILPVVLFGGGIAIYLEKGKREPTPAAAHAMAQATATASSIDSYPVWIRYPGALALLYGAYYFAFESNQRVRWVAIACAVSCLIYAAICAYEISIWAIGIALVGLGIWGVMDMAHEVPVNVAIIVGALIIAAAIVYSRKSNN